MSDPITGKVTNIIDKYTIAINIGTQDGVEVGMKFKVGGQEIEIIDPDSQEKLGFFTYTKARVRVFKVDEKYSLAKSYEKVYRKTLPFPSFLTTRYIIKPLPLEDSKDLELEENIKVSDKVVQILQPDLSENQTEENENTS